MAMKHGPYLLTERNDPGFRNQVPEKTSLYLLFGAQVDWVRSKISLVSLQEPLLATVKRQKRLWFGHVTCHDSLSKISLQGTLEVGPCFGQQRKCWMDSIEESTSLPMPELFTRAFCGKDLNRISAESSVMSPRCERWFFNIPLNSTSFFVVHHDLPSCNKNWHPSSCHYSSTVLQPGIAQSEVLLDIRKYLCMVLAQHFSPGTKHSLAGTAVKCILNLTVEL